MIALRGVRVAIAGVDPASYRVRRMLPDGRSDPTVELAILLCHFPRVVERLPANGFDVILAGHLHGGQICVPLPGRRVTLAHPRAERVSGFTRPGRHDARIAGNGNNVRSVTVLRAPRGDRARPAPTGLTSCSWRCIAQFGGGFAPGEDWRSSTCCQVERSPRCRSLTARARRRTPCACSRAANPTSAAHTRARDRVVKLFDALAT